MPSYCTCSTCASTSGRRRKRLAVCMVHHAPRSPTTTRQSCQSPPPCFRNPFGLPLLASYMLEQLRDRHVSAQISCASPSYSVPLSSFRKFHLALLTQPNPSQTHRSPGYYVTLSPPTSESSSIRFTSLRHADKQVKYFRPVKCQLRFLVLSQRHRWDRG